MRRDRAEARQQIDQLPTRPDTLQRLMLDIITLHLQGRWHGRIVISRIGRRRWGWQAGHRVGWHEALGGLVFLGLRLLLRFGSREVEDHAIALVRDHA